MVKELLLVRHAKSDWVAGLQRDFDRPLNQRGVANAPEMAQRLVDKEWMPELIVTSPALRAKTTAQLFAEVWGGSEIREEKRIYEASIQTLLKVVNGFDNSFHKIALFGHNPAITDFVYALSDAWLGNMPTASYCLLEFSIDNWALVSAGTGKLLAFDYPKSIL